MKKFIMLFTCFLQLVASCNFSEKKIKHDDKDIQKIKSATEKLAINDSNNSKPLEKGILIPSEIEIPDYVFDSIYFIAKKNIELKRGLPIETDNSFKVTSSNQYKAHKGWKCFLIKGEYLPSNTPIHFYGAFKNIDTVGIDYYTFDMEITTELISFDSDNNSIIIYGYQWDTSGLEADKFEKKIKKIYRFPSFRSGY